MKLNAFTWKMYQERNESQMVMQTFSEVAEKRNEIEIAFKYNEQLKKFYDTPQNTTWIRSFCDTLWHRFINNAPDASIPQTLEEARVEYENLVEKYKEHEESINPKINGYKEIHGWITWFSFMLFEYAPDFFFPYLYQYSIHHLYKVADTFEIELPPLPKKADHKGRCMFYWELCEKLYKFRIDNNLSPVELCAFLYDFAPNYITKFNSDMPEPANAWFIGGKIEDEDLENLYWQANADTKKGDILVHYETSPVSAITCVWRSATDGVIDPFFQYYGNIYLRDQILVPPITFKELKEDAHFSKFPLVRKRFQGVNGWQMGSKDYSELIRIWQSKGFDTSVLPKLYAPKLINDIDIVLEKDVEEKLLIPMLLTPMGLKYKIDYDRQIPLRTGHGHRVFEDFAIHLGERNGQMTARVIVEAKRFEMKSRYVAENLTQAISYASLMHSSVIVLCYKDCILIFQDDNGFDRDRYKKVYWGELEDPDVFNEVKAMLL